MAKIYKTYKYRMYPNKEQEQVLARYFGSVRFVYNHFLAERKRQYEENRESDNYYAQAKTLTLLKKKEDFAWLKEINAQTLQFSLRCLETAYTNFFSGRAKFPRFKVKKHGGSFAIPQNCSIKDGKIFIPKFKQGIKIKEHRAFRGNVRKMTISVTPSGKYYVSILSEVEHKPLRKTNKKVGVDLGIKDFIVTSDGVRYSSNKFIKHYAKKLAKIQKCLSRKHKDSGEWCRMRLRVARIHEKIHNCRMDKLHKISTDLVRNYDVICCEDLNVKGMQKNYRLSQSISDARWYTFLNLLSYKCDREGKHLVKIDRFYPSSKTCHHCGYVKKDLSLKERIWKCPHCGQMIDRDFNASINILNEGIRNISAGTVDHTEGADVRPIRRRSALKSEAHESLVHG